MHRWGFVQKFRAAKLQAADGGGPTTFDSMAAGADGSESDSSEAKQQAEGGVYDSDMDW